MARVTQRDEAKSNSEEASAPARLDVAAEKNPSNSEPVQSKASEKGPLAPTLRSAEVSNMLRNWEVGLLADGTAAPGGTSQDTAGVAAPAGSANQTGPGLHERRFG